MIGHFRGNHLC